MRTLTMLLVGFGLVAGGSGAAEATTAEPLCFSAGPPLERLLRLFFTEITPEDFAVIGQSVVVGRTLERDGAATGSVHGSLFIPPVGDTARIALILPMDLAGNSTVAVAADLNFATGSGPGRCQRLGGGASGCSDVGSPVTITSIGCPP
jgi:hypothetical protein